MQLELRGGKISAFILRVIAADARHVHERIGVLDAAFEFQRIMRGVIVRMIRAQLPIPLQHLHVALQDRIAAHAESRSVTGDVEGRTGADVRCARTATRSARDRRRRAQQIIRRGGADHRLIRGCSGGQDKQRARDHEGPVPARR